MQVLLVDDSRTVIAVFGARLAALGYEVVAAENGQVAVERFQASAPDLVLMDIEMPVMGGFEAAQRIRAVEATQEWAWTPIIFLTASDTPENLVMAIEAGGDDFLAKSAPEAVLQAKMKAMTRIAALRAELSLANRKLEALASRDGLTGLFNRRHMDVRLDHQWAEAVTSGASFGLLMIDVDHFKKYNDRHGHPAGDEVLRGVARLLSEGRRANDLVARYGGEEFAVVLVDTPKLVAAQVAEKLRQRIEQFPFLHRDTQPGGRVTVSIGVAALPDDAADSEALVRTADASLYRAKSGGRNAVVLAG